MKKVAVTDDHPLVVDGLRILFNKSSQYEWAGGFYSGHETMEKIVLVQPDLLFLDVALPDGDGISLCQKIKSTLPKIKIIAITSFSELAIVKSMMHKGADGYLLKTAGHELILKAAAQVLENMQFLDPEVQNLIVADSLNQKRTVGFIPKLTRREHEVLQLIADELTTPEIADRLCINHKTVESHRMNILQKFGAKNMAGLVRAAMEKGII